MKTVEQIMMLVYAYGAAPDDKHAEPLKALRTAIEELHKDAARFNWMLPNMLVENGYEPSADVIETFIAGIDESMKEQL